jgi:hypothetical protein
MSEASSATPKAAPAPKTRKNTPVDYEVYQVGAGTLHVVTTPEGGTVVSAANDIKAIQAALGGQAQAGKYVAIPLRSLRVREVGTETQVRVVIK